MLYEGNSGISQAHRGQGSIAHARQRHGTCYMTCSTLEAGWGTAPGIGSGGGFGGFGFNGYGGLVWVSFLYGAFARGHGSVGRIREISAGEYFSPIP